MCPVAINGVDKQGIDINGVQVKQALSPANSTVNKGVYDATLLETVDADLTAGNIKSGVTIFGKAGTVIPGGTETIEKYADATIANDATYTPAASGIFFSGGWSAGSPHYTSQYYSTLAATWYYVKGSSTGKGGVTSIGDGTNFRIKNMSGENREYCLMRHYYSLGTYERARDEHFAAGATWTPAVSGFFSDGAESSSCWLELQFTTAGWKEACESGGTGAGETIAIGDGTNLRVRGELYNPRYHVTMRAKLT